MYIHSHIYYIFTQTYLDIHQTICSMRIKAVRFGCGSERYLKYTGFKFVCRSSEVCLWGSWE